jgi:hypothetical protein
MADAEDYGVLSTLVYGDSEDPVLSSVRTSGGKTIGEVLSAAWEAAGVGDTRTVAQALDSISEDDLRRLREYTDATGTRMNGDDWADVIEECQTNPEISSLTIVDNDTQVSEGGRNITLADGDNNAVIVYRGTGADQWDDDVTLLAEPTTKHDEEALAYYREMDERYGTVTPIGHSNGGHEAMYIAIMEGVACYAYDGEGFNFEFYAQHHDLWLANSDCVNLYNADADFVDCLLLYPGEPQNIHFLASQRLAGKDFGAYHSPVTLFDQDMGFVPGEASPLNFELRLFTAWMALQPRWMRDVMTAALAPFVQSVMSGEDPRDALRSSSCAPSPTHGLQRSYAREASSSARRWPRRAGRRQAPTRTRSTTSPMRRSRASRRRRARSPQGSGTSSRRNGTRAMAARAGTRDCPSVARRCPSSRLWRQSPRRRRRPSRRCRGPSRQSSRSTRAPLRRLTLSPRGSMR